MRKWQPGMPLRRISSGCAINELLTLEQIGKFDAWEKTGVIPDSQLDYYKHHACPSCGACSFMGTASTMQIMAEALGLMLPGTALMPATAPELNQAAYDAGKQLMELVRKGIRARDIVTKESFENAIMVHAAISGSTNATMHLPAIAHEFGIEIDADTFDRMHRGAHYLLNIRPSGDWPAQYFYYAGGVPRVMEEIKSMLHLDVMTVTGKTLGENLEELKNSGFYDHCDAILAEKTRGFSRKVTREDIIHSFDNAKGTDGSIAILKGNLAPEGCVIKHTACPKNMFHATLRAKPFDSEESCIHAVLHGEVKPGDAIFIRYEGPRGSGMPEMFYTGEAICADPKLASSVALITDGRFSGASRGPVIGRLRLCRSGAERRQRDHRHRPHLRGLRGAACGAEICPGDPGLYGPADLPGSGHRRNHRQPDQEQRLHLRCGVRLPGRDWHSLLHGRRRPGRAVQPEFRPGGVRR